METIEAPQKMECFPIWPTYIGEKGRNLGKTHGINAKHCWEHHWGKTSKILGTYWEPDGNLKGTCWEQMEKWEQSFIVGRKI